MKSKKGYVNYKLKAAIAEMGTNQANVAMAADMTPATLSRKINGKLLFDEFEMYCISKFLKKSITELFFCHEVTKWITEYSLDSQSSS